MSTPSVTDDVSSQAGSKAGLSALVIPALLAALGVFLLVGNADMEIAGDSELFGPKAFPLATAVLCFVVAIALAITIVRHPEPAQGPVDEEGNPLPGAASNWRSLLITLGAFVMFAILLVPAGWIIAGAVAFWGITYGMGSTRYVPNLMVGLVLSSIVQIVFGGLLGLSLPAGVMGMF